MSNQVRLGDIFDFKNGRAFKKTEWSSSGLPIIRIQNLNNSRASFNYYSGSYDERIEVKKGDLLFSWSGTVGSSFGPHIWNGETGVLNQHIFRVALKDGIEKRYAYYALLEITSEIEKSVSGAVGIVHVTQANLKNFKIPVPNVSEQKRIVAILDEALAGIDAAIANTEKNLANARELFESYASSVFSLAPSHWQKIELAQICSIKHGFAFKSEYFSDKGPYIVLTPGSFHESGGFRDQGKKTKFYVANPPAEYVLKKGDFLIAMTEQAVGLLGSCLEVPESGRFLHNQRLGLVEVHNGVDWHNDFFFHQFNTSKFRSAVQATASGVKVRHTSPGKLGAIEVLVPPLTEQVEVSAKLNTLLSETRRLEEVQQLKLASLTELRQSLLHKAFSGEFTGDSAEIKMEEAVA
ncbi:restriction endonuclease subunit S [Marinobacter sp. NFXS11]|uniref:restriction endonuclease subunit S n=1 Tax=Marinobacter sp. NFXS11 TaxID=2818432 RepID=UPI0032DF22EA